jgi:hypothetical protein
LEVELAHLTSIAQKKIFVYRKTNKSLGIGVRWSRS